MFKLDKETTVDRKLNAFLENPLGYLSYEKIALFYQPDEPDQQLYIHMALEIRRTCILGYITALKDFDLISDETYNEFDSKFSHMSAMPNDIDIVDRIRLYSKKP